jgi:hypothetical protein
LAAIVAEMVVMVVATAAAVAGAAVAAAADDNMGNNDMGNGNVGVDGRQWRHWQQRNTMWAMTMAGSTADNGVGNNMGQGSLDQKAEIICFLSQSSVDGNHGRYHRPELARRAHRTGGALARVRSLVVELLEHSPGGRQL